MFTDRKRARQRPNLECNNQKVRPNRPYYTMSAAGITATAATHPLNDRNDLDSRHRAAATTPQSRQLSACMRACVRAALARTRMSRSRRRSPHQQQ